MMNRTQPAITPLCKRARSTLPLLALLLCLQPAMGKASAGEPRTTMASLAAEHDLRGDLLAGAAAALAGALTATWVSRVFFGSRQPSPSAQPCDAR